MSQVRIELYDRKQTKFISAHNTALACLTLSMDGKRLATASDKGTLIRVWNTADGQLLQVRGAMHGMQAGWWKSQTYLAAEQFTGGSSSVSFTALLHC